MTEEFSLEELILWTQSTIREFEDLKRKLSEEAPRDKINLIFEELFLRANIFREHSVSGARRLKWKLKALKKIVDVFEEGSFSGPKEYLMKKIRKRLDSIENRLIKRRDKFEVAQRKHKLIHAKI